jgi:FlaG/FlaF family flagellin (archaellin)
MDDRAATETLGMVLLLAIVILLAATIGLSLLTQTSAIQDGTERSYLNIEPDLNTSALTLIHAGGPSFQTSNLTLILQNDTGRQRYDPGDFTVSGPDDVFETGDRLTVSHSFTGYVDIALYSSETDERLYRAVRSTNPSSDISTPPTDGSTGPTAQIAALSQVAEGFNITLDGSGSTDPDGSVDSYEWTIVSGPGTIVEDDTATPTAEYQSPSDVSGDQNVTVELTVTDDDGNTDTETFEITVVDTDTAEAPEDSSGDGSAFNDTNGNGVYDEGEEVVSKDDLEDGYNDPDTDLVIYPVVGEIRTSGNNNPVDITANTITAGSNFRASGGTINLVADGDIRIDDVTLESNGNGGITITSREGRIFANRTTMLATSGNAPIDFNSNGDIYLESADLDGGSYSADLGTSSATLYVDQMTIDGTLVYDPDDITVDPSGADGDTVSSN